MDERARLERELSEAKKKLAMGGGARAPTAADGVRAVGDVKLLARAVEGIELKDLRSLADEGKKQVGSGVVAIVGKTDDGKAGIVVGVTADLTARFSAVDLVRKGAEALGGKGGGGRPDMAQAGGPDGSKADAALAAIEAAHRRLNARAWEGAWSTTNSTQNSAARRAPRTSPRHRRPMRPPARPRAICAASR